MKKLAIEGGKKALNNTDIPLDQQPYSEADLQYVKEVLESKRYSLFNNETVRKLEEKLASYLCVKGCCMVTNCTSALDASFRALEIGSGNEVIMPAYTYAATMMAILSSGAKPVLVDIDYDTLTLDTHSIRNRINEQTKAIVPVHIFGNPCDMNSLIELANMHGLRVIEDCAHAFGAKYEDRIVGSFDIGCHSFGENKILRIGEGGAITSDDEEFLKKVEIIRHEGEVWSQKQISTTRGGSLNLTDILGGIDYTLKGHNFRPSPILAALGLSRLEAIDEYILSMNKNAERYTSLLKYIEGIKLPQQHRLAERIYSSYIILVDGNGIDRDALFTATAMEGIPVGVHFPTPIHKTTVYKTFSKDFNFPNAERFCANHLALPIYPSLQKGHIDIIGEVFTGVIEKVKQNPKEIKERAEELMRKLPIKNFYSGVYITL